MNTEEDQERSHTEYGTFSGKMQPDRDALSQSQEQMYKYFKSGNQVPQNFLQQYPSDHMQNVQTEGSHEMDHQT